jgi:hypothetical protein
MRSEYRSERKVIARTDTKVTVRRTLTILQNRIAECERFYPWPALVSSLREDVTLLQDRLNELQSKKRLLNDLTHSQVDRTLQSHQPMQPNGATDVITPTGVEAEVCELIAKRQQLGIAKYGMTVADNPLALRDWLQHALEEVLDQAVYLKRAINDLDVLQPLVVTRLHPGSMTLDAPGRIGLKGLTDIHYEIEQDEFVVLVKVTP